VAPDGTMHVNEFDQSGRWISTVDRDGNATRVEYDAMGRAIAELLPDATPDDLTDNPRIRREYDALNRVIAEVDPLGNRTEYEYDAAGNRVLTRDPLGHETTVRYDSVGRPVVVIDALRHETHIEYDDLNRPIKMTLPDGTVNTRSYDAGGRITATRDSLGNITRYEHDLAGRLTAVVDAMGGRTEYGYDEVGNLVRQRDAKGHVTRYEYDGHRRPTAITRPSGDQETTVYNPDGAVASTTDFNGNTIRFTYDRNGKVVRRSYSDGSTVSFVYDAAGNRLSETDDRGTVQSEYDALGRLVSRSEPDGERISYTYNTVGQTTSIVSAGGTTVYSYDANGRIANVVDSVTGTTSYHYDATGNLVRRDLPNGIVEHRSYDAVGRLLELRVEDAGQSVLEQWTYTYDARGRRSTASTLGGGTTTFSYDPLGRLTSENIVDPVLGNRLIRYAYDAVGNRTRRDDSVDGETVYSYNADDQLVTEVSPGGVVHYVYDKNGNLISRSADPQDQTTYHYDFNDRLVAAEVVNGATTDRIAFRYDADGNRVSRSENGQLVRYLQDTNRQFSQVREEIRVAGNDRVHYTYGNRLIARSDPSEIRFYHQGPLGTVLALSNPSGIVTDRYILDAYGRTLATHGTSNNSYLFTGEPRDPRLGIDFLRARYRDPRSGRFLTVDPFGGSTRDPLTLHRYLYANDDPVNKFDPAGTLTLAEQLTVFALLSVTIAAVQYTFSASQIGPGNIGYKGIFVAVAGQTPASGLFSVGGALAHLVSQPLPGARGIERNVAFGGYFITGLSLDFTHALTRLKIPGVAGLGGVSLGVPKLIQRKLGGSSFSGGMLLITGVSVAVGAGFAYAPYLQLGFGRGNASGQAIGLDASAFGITTGVGLSVGTNFLVGNVAPISPLPFGDMDLDVYLAPWYSLPNYNVTNIVDLVRPNSR